MTLKDILKLLLAWRILILASALPAMLLIPIRPGFTYLTPGFSISNLFQMWASFDGQHYFNLARYGYGSFYTGYLQAFFPLFPLLARLLGGVIGNYLASGLIISHLALIAAAWFFFQLIKLETNTQTARTALFLLLIFPTAFFLGSLYSESLFLAVTLVSVYAARRGNWFIACLFAGLASATRVSGIFLLPLLLLEFYSAHKNNLRTSLSDKRLFLFLLAPLGLLAYMRYLSLSVGDPFFFVNIQPLFGAQREVGRFVLLYQVFFRYAKMMIFIDHTDPLFFTVLLELISGTLFFVLTVLSFKLSRLSYALYALLSYLLPTLTGTFSSMPRYVLVLFPCFIVLSKWYVKQSPSLRLLYSLISLLLSLFSISLFTRGYFVG